MAKLSTEAWIAKARLKHGDKYDYDKVIYVNNRTKVKIICPEHGEFEQIAKSHELRGAGCLNCSGHNIPTTEEWIIEAIKKHGDKYDYSKVIYVSNKKKVIIGCPVHGDFEQVANNHLRLGQNCPACSGKIPHTTETFIAKVRELHSDKYDYSKTVFVRGSDKVIIICPVHGEFKQRAEGHLKQGCNDCGIEKSATSMTSNTEEWIVKAIAKHGDKYDYSKVAYISNNKNVIIICDKHGEFHQMPGNHLTSQGCFDCGIDTSSEKTRRTTSEFIALARKAHGDKYDYSKVDYKSGKLKVIIICPEHGEFEQNAGNHITGTNCPCCAHSGGFNTMIPGTLYYLRVETRNQLCYKIGITNNSVKQRFKVSDDMDKITILSEKFYPSGIDALNEETRILNKFKAFKYTGEPMLSSGNTELFTKDVLLLDHH